jgi:hypothetical protein
MAFTTAPSARWMTPFSGPIQRSCESLTLDVEGQSQQTSDVQGEEGHCVQVPPCLAPVGDERVEAPALDARGEVRDGGADYFVAAAYGEGLTPLARFPSLLLMGLREWSTSSLCVCSTGGREIHAFVAVVFG